MLYIKDNGFKTLSGSFIKFETQTFSEGLYVISGENGSGKSSFFNALYYANINLCINGRKYERGQRNTQISYATQNNLLLDRLTVTDNINLSEVNFEKVREILEQLDAQYLLEDNNQFNKLSGGEKQKIKLAIALSKECPVILLDEIDSNLDNESVNELFPLLLKYAKQSVILIISHNFDLYTNNIDGHLRIEDDIMKYEQLSTNNELIMTDKSEKAGAKRKLSELKPLSIYFRKSYFLYALIAILFSSVFISTTNDLSRLTYAKDTYTKKYTNNSSIITPPINSPYYALLGDESWLEKTPLLFDQSTYEKLKSLDYVTDITFIPNVTSFSNYSTYLKGKKEYKLKNDQINIDPSNLNTSVKTLMDKNNIVLKASYQVEFGQLELQNKVVSNTPYTVTYNLLYGSYPADNTNQVMIPLEVAEFLIERDNLNSIDEVIGNKYEVQLEEVDGVHVIGSGKQNFEISGIYNSADQTDQSSIIYAYSDNSLVTKSNNCGVDKGLELEGCALDTAAETYDEDQFRKLVDNGEVGNYSGFYVEVKSEEDLKQLTKLVREYDKNIYIDNDYTRSKEFINSSSRRRIIDVSKQYAIVLLIYLVVILILYKFQLNQMKKVNQLLDHINFPQELRNKYTFNKLRVLPLIGIVFLLIPYFKRISVLRFDYVTYGFYNKQYLLLMTIIYVVMISVLILYNKLILKLLVQGRNNEN